MVEIKFIVSTAQHGILHQEIFTLEDLGLEDNTAFRVGAVDSIIQEKFDEWFENLFNGGWEII